METLKKNAEKFSKSVTWKVIIIGVISLLLLIPGAMIMELIRERKLRNDEAVAKINNLWSNDQTLNGPVLTIPYEVIVKDEKSQNTVRHHLTLTPEELTITGVILPQEKYLGIYKSIIYNSDLMISGYFPTIDFSKIEHSRILWNEAFLRIGISDLRGVSSIPDFKLNGKIYKPEAGGTNADEIGQGLIVLLNSMQEADGSTKTNFSCQLKLKGSNSLNFIPLGRTTNVKLKGDWNAPGFTGNFNPEHKISEKDFQAEWKVLHFNRNIPEKWIDNKVENFDDTIFGVKLVDMINHYQQTERSAKYAIMFIALTFVVFFFVEILTGKRVHPVQYMLVGLGLILFYSLLLSLSEQIGFGLAYLIACGAIIGMVSVYTGTIFKNYKQTGLLALILGILYSYLYVVIQIEDIALLIGSIGLFIILGIIMFFSTKINWYKPTEIAEEEKTA
jgi:inner membrane protein